MKFFEGVSLLQQTIKNVMKGKRGPPDLPMHRPTTLQLISDHLYYLYYIRNKILDLSKLMREQNVHF